MAGIRSMESIPFIPGAPVTAWNNEYVYVHCHFCGQGHRHSFKGYLPEEGIASRPCSHSSELTRQYRFEFPFREAKSGSTEFVGYEIRKQWSLANGKESEGEGWYVAVGAKEKYSSFGKDNGPKYKDQEDELSNSLQKLGFQDKSNNAASQHVLLDQDETKTSEPKSKDAGNVRPPALKGICFADHDLLDLLAGNTGKAEKFLTTSPDAGLFVNGRDPDGNTTLIIASAEEQPYMLRLLLEHGANVNSSNDRGRTALMEAALWGCVKNVEILLAHGADKHLRDKVDWPASWFARASKFNTEEREERDLFRVERENPLEVARHRREIVALLTGKDPSAAGLEHQALSQIAAQDDVLFHRQSDTNTIILYRPSAKFRVFGKNTTIARLDCGPPITTVDAMSGYTHAGGWLGPDVISGERYTKQVMRICELIGYELPAHSYDGRIRGQYLACHAEKQLVAYFIDKHVFLEDELFSKDDYAQQKSKLQKKNEAQGMARRMVPDPVLNVYVKKWEKELNDLGRRSLKSLSTAEPPVRLTKATILVSKEPCPDCERFFKKVEEKLGLTFDAKDCSVRPPTKLL
ncbi:hypothetical protein MMC10_003390 [Thelotrema lepadinum]|nr:hypothetical protein [Thelotrema lepadinum]